jgi:tRNA(adenine34) deaminase
MEEKYMNEALIEAQKAFELDEVPIGCVIVKNDKIISRGYNLRESTQKSTKHAEIVAIESACEAINSWRLEECDIYITLEPCPMCAGAILQSRIKNVIYGASDFKGGSLGSCFNMYDIKGFNHYPTITKGVMQEECSEILKKFFKNKR